MVDRSRIPLAVCCALCLVGAASGHCRLDGPVQCYVDSGSARVLSKYVVLGDPTTPMSEFVYVCDLDRLELTWFIRMPCRANMIHCLAKSPDLRHLRRPHLSTHPRHSPCIALERSSGCEWMMNSDRPTDMSPPTHSTVMPTTPRSSRILRADLLRAQLHSRGGGDWVPMPVRHARQGGCSGRQGLGVRHAVHCQCVGDVWWI
jgi:hypothetical protein